MKNRILSNVLLEFGINLSLVNDFLQDELKYKSTLGEDALISPEIYDRLKEEFGTNRDETQVYSGSSFEESETQVYSESDFEEDKTATYEEQISARRKISQHNITNGDVIELNEKKYTIVSIISEGTGEAIIYKVVNESEEVLALKLYFEFANAKHEPNGETLQRIKGIIDVDVLKLIDYGVGFQKFQNKFCFEISEFAKGGDLLNVNDFKTKYTARFIEEHVIAEIYNGIEKLHKEKIWHCDLKPGNIFYLDEAQQDLIIGDYGSAKAYDKEDLKEVIKTSTVKGSNFYLAPEQSRGLVSDKNDYYSFGMILLHLLYPEKFAKDDDYLNIDKDKFEDIVERGDSSMPIIDYDPKYSRINKLIEGLTLNVRKNRWGGIQVQKWIDGKDDELVVKYLSNRTAPDPELKLGKGVTIRTEEDFLKYLVKNDDWKETLIDDSTTKVAFFTWIDNYYDVDIRKLVRDDIIPRTEQNISSKIHSDKRKAEDVDYTKQALLRFFKPDYPIVIESKRFEITTGDIVKNVDAIISALDSKSDGQSVEKIRFVLFQLEISLKKLLEETDDSRSKKVLKGLLEKIYAGLGIQGVNFDNVQSEIAKAINSNQEDMAYKKIVELFYTFRPDRGFNYDHKQYDSVEKIGILFIEKESIFDKKKVIAEKERFFNHANKSALNALDRKHLIFEIFKQEAVSKIAYKGLTFDKHRDFVVNYSYYKSLSSFLSKNNIQKDISSQSDETEVLNLKRKVFQKFGSVFTLFIKQVKAKHGIATLPRTNKEVIRIKFLKDCRKQYFRVYRGQFLAATLLAITLYLAYPIYFGWTFSYNDTIQNNNDEPLFQFQNIPDDFFDETSESNIVDMSQTGYISAERQANIRSGPSTDYEISDTLNRGAEVLLLKWHKTENWYEVRYNGGFSGFVSGKLISFEPLETASDNSEMATNVLTDKAYFMGAWEVRQGDYAGSSYDFRSGNRGSFTNKSGSEYLLDWKLKNNNSILEIKVDNDPTNVFNWELSDAEAKKVLMNDRSRNMTRTIHKISNVAETNVTNDNNSYTSSIKRDKAFFLGTWEIVRGSYVGGVTYEFLPNGGTYDSNQGWTNKFTWDVTKNGTNLYTYFSSRDYSNWNLISSTQNKVMLKKENSGKEMTLKRLEVEEEPTIVYHQAPEIVDDNFDESSYGAVKYHLSLSTKVYFTNNKTRKVTPLILDEIFTGDNEFKLHNGEFQLPAGNYTALIKSTAGEGRDNGVIEIVDKEKTIQGIQIRKNKEYKLTWEMLY